MPDPTLHDGQTEIPLDAFFERFLESAVEHRGSAPGLRDWVDLAEAWRITHALRACRGNRSAAARALGIGRRTLYSKMEKLHIAPTFAPFGDGR
jgi:DNA-binding NtrC family response regulator